MHHFIKFHYGPHWSLHLQGSSNNNRNNNKLTTISPSDLKSCLSQLPFLACCGKLSIRSLDGLCCIEQVQVGEDLRFKLTENMLSCCNSTFIHQFIQSQQLSFNHSANNHHRNSFFSHNKHHHNQETSGTTWAWCFLFAREKIIAQCCNVEDELSNEIVYFLKLLVSHYLQEKHESGNKIIRWVIIDFFVNILNY